MSHYLNDGGGGNSTSRKKMRGDSSGDGQENLDETRNPLHKNFSWIRNAT